MKVTIPIPKKYRPEERKAIAQEVVDFIVERTLSGKDKDNINFKPYSKSYVKSLDFKIAGKSASNVNLKLSGDMLASLKPLTHRSGSITVGYEAGDENNGKAEGNIKGTYGNKKQVAPKRDFLGIKEGTLRNKILKNYPLTSPEKRLERVAAVQLAEEAAKEIK